MTEDKTQSILVLKVPYSAFENLHEGWEHMKEKGLNITFDRYVFGVLMFGHNTLHKSLGMLAIMMEYAEDDEEDDDE